jgi:hypothetical protein
MSQPAAIETDPLAAATEIAKAYLAAMEERDLARAATFVSPQAVFIFPGGARRQGLAAIVAGSATRYQFVGKHVEGYDAAMAADGGVNVYVRGTLHGRWLDGSAFEGIRFIDRFAIRDGKIRSQEVWNDAGEVRCQRRGVAPMSATSD